MPTASHKEWPAAIRTCPGIGTGPCGVKAPRFKIGTDVEAFENLSCNDLVIARRGVNCLLGSRHPLWPARRARWLTKPAIGQIVSFMVCCLYGYGSS